MYAAATMAIIGQAFWLREPEPKELPACKGRSKHLGRVKDQLNPPSARSIGHRKTLERIAHQVRPLCRASSEPRHERSSDVESLAHDRGNGGNDALRQWPAGLTPW